MQMLLRDRWFSKQAKALQDGLYVTALSILRNESDAEDAVQNAVMKAYKNLDALSSKDKFKPWIFRILKNDEKNYAAQLLYVTDKTIQPELKKRYYDKLAKLDKSFSCFENPEDSSSFKSECEIAITYLRNRTRNNHLVQEENINYGLCKNLLNTKPVGIIISV